MRVALIIASTVLATVLGVVQGHAEKRVALVIGNSTYRFVGTLRNPGNDARLIATKLRNLGFTLVNGGAQLDLDKAGIDRAVQEFGRELKGADVGLLYYSGHGVQVRGANYLVPVDANPSREADVDFQALDAQLVLRQMEASGTRLNIVILDACRNNPWGGRGLRDLNRGLARMDAPAGTLIAFATQPGNVAQDGTDGDSPYAKALAAVIDQPGLHLFDTFNQVGLAVDRATGHEQVPWFSSSPINGDFQFASISPGGLIPPPKIEPVVVPPLPPPGGLTPPPIEPVIVQPRPPLNTGFIFADSDRRRLSMAELSGRSPADLRVGRNEIYARRGRIFDSPDLQAYFSRFPWYQPRFRDVQLSDIESANVALFLEAEKRFAAVTLPSNAQGRSDFIFPDSDRRLLTPADLNGLTPAQLRIARNEIFARRGRIFDSDDLRQRFGSFPWYRPTSKNPSLNAVEQQNVELIQRAEQRP